MEKRRTRRTVCAGLSFCCALAISLPIVLVFSGRGMTHYSVYHLCGLALVAAALVEYARARLVPAKESAR